MTPRFQRIIEALHCKREGNSYRCECPVHPPGTHFIVSEPADKILFNCKLAATQPEIIAALIELKLWNDRNGDEDKPIPRGKLATRPKKRELVAEYQYKDAAGTVVAVKGRFTQDGEKTFRWRMPDSEKWEGLKDIKETDLPLYGSEHLAAAPPNEPVFLLEGEKAVWACWKQNLMAVCLPGGSSAKDFGTSLAVLAGRDVVLWPDNDQAGRALMHRLKQKLGDAASVRDIAPAVPERGDAYDYFESGKTKDNLMVELAQVHSEPWCEPTETGYLVSVPDSGGLVRLAFDELTQRPHTLETDATVWQEISGSTRERFGGRLNLLSLSARESVRRQLDEMFDRPKGFWTGIMNRACQMVRQAHMESDPSTLLSTIPDVGPVEHILWPWVASEGPTILFGKGGSGKTELALAWALAASFGLEIMGVQPRQLGVLFLDYESTAVVIKRRCLALLRGMGLDQTAIPIHYWPGRGVPLVDMVPGLLRKIRAAAIGWLIVDSAALAAGGEPEKAETALRYFNALAQLGIPSLTIAHPTKKEEDQYPFGSVFWHNSARATWNFKKVHELDENVIHCGLFHRKINEGKLERPTGLRIEFGDSVRVHREELVFEFSREMKLPDRIRRTLAGGAMSVKALASATSSQQEIMGRTLRRMQGVVQLDRDEDGTYLWGLSQ